MSEPITDAQMQASRDSLEQALDTFGKTALKVKEQRDQLDHVLLTVIVNLQHGAPATEVAQWAEEHRLKAWE